jgi:hypothetical protein
MVVPSRYLRLYLLSVRNRDRLDKSYTKRYGRIADVRPPRNFKRSIGIEQELKGLYRKEYERSV